jgi:hypothetical protein
MLSHIFLFGHRQQHGKDTCCNLLEKIFKEKKIAYTRTYFAKLLKKQISERYNLDFNKMDDNDYKKWIPPWVSPKNDVPRTVRQILIDEGNLARSIWLDAWANSVYQEILNSKSEVGIVSDYRFPNEYKSFDRSYELWYKSQVSITGTMEELKPKVIRVLVHRPNGVFKNDGADGELPDLEKPEEWDYIVMNEDRDGWESRLKDQVIGIMEMEKIL